MDWVEVWKAWVGSGLLPEATPFQEKREDEQRWLNRLTILLTILFCFRLSYTQPFRHSVVDGDGVYTGEDRVAKNGKIQQAFLIGDDQGGLEWRQMGNKTCIRHVFI